jgi:hypothetical protein
VPLHERLRVPLGKDLHENRPDEGSVITKLNAFGSRGLFHPLSASMSVTGPTSATLLIGVNHRPSARLS